MTSTPKNCLYEGWVRHRRIRPTQHAFRSNLFMLLLDLDELDTVFRGRWFWSTKGPNLAWFRRRDHAGDHATPLAQTIREMVESRTGRATTGPVRLLTHLRYFGIGMNPVSFYFVYDSDGVTLDAIVAEVHNTPWNEMHCYVLPITEATPRGRFHRFRFAKDFHVSPFHPMDQMYDWKISPPGDRLLVHMDNHEDTERPFDATMALHASPITGRGLARVLIRYPLMTTQVLAQIYWHALRLKLKGTPFHSHPKSVRESAA